MEENKYERYNFAVHEITNTVYSMIRFDLEWVLTADDIRNIMLDVVYVQSCEDWIVPVTDMSVPWVDFVRAAMARDIMSDIEDCI